MAILGWIEMEIRIPSLGLPTVRLWVADTMSSKGTPFILGSNQIKKIFSQVNTENTDSWPQPWRSIHYRYTKGNHCCNEDSDDLYDSADYDTEEEDSFELLSQLESQITPSTSHSSLDSWLGQIEYPTPPKELNNLSKEKPASKGITDQETGSDVNGNSTPATKVNCVLPRRAEQFQNNGGGETSVFTNLAVESEGLAAEAEFPACNLKVPAPSVDYIVELPPCPTVSCRITPEGDTTFNL